MDIQQIEYPTLEIPPGLRVFFMEELKNVRKWQPVDIHNYQEEQVIEIQKGIFLKEDIVRTQNT